MTERTTVLLCDFFGVLTTQLAPAFAAVQEANGLPPQALGKAMALLTQETGAHPLFELECGRLTEPEFLDLVQDAVQRTSGRDAQMHAFTERYFAALDVNAPMLEAVAEAKAAGLRTSLVTNNVREWEPRWRAMLPVDELFDDVVDSAYVGVRKPDPRIFEIALERLGAEGRDCVFVDDFASNCEAARALGIRAVHLETTDATVAELRGLLS